jgi:hypothetical protein
MIPEIECTIYDSEKIDALTITSKSVAGRAMIAGVYSLFSDESENLAFSKNWQALGYKGYQCDSVRYGKRLDSSALFSTGGDSMKITHILINDYDYMSLHTTRIDVCIDVCLVDAMRGWLRGLRENPDFSALHEREKRETKIIESDTGDTLYIGNRTSGRFGRIYDKSFAYGVDLGYVYRFELETKRLVAPAVFKRLFPENEDTTYSWDCFPSRVRNIIQGQFAAWGINISLNAKVAEIIKAETRISTVDSQLQWLSRSVAPMISRLSAAGYKQQAMEAIGLNVVEFT